MAAQLGSESFIAFTGRVIPITETVEEITRDFINGHEYRTSGKKGPITKHFATRDIDTAANAKTKIATYLALIGTLVTLTYDDATTLSNVMILDCEIKRVYKCAVAAGGIAAGTFMIEMEWTLQATE